MIAVVLAVVGCGSQHYAGGGSPRSSPASRSQPVATSAPVVPSSGDRVARTQALPVPAAGPYRVVHVVDGDTVRVRRARRIVTVQLIGIDTPETRDPRRPVECFGREAAAHASAMLAGRVVYLEVDSSQGQKDKYGRTLAYVWLPGRPATLVNERMIHDGFAVQYTHRLPYRYQARFRAAEVDARSHSRGLWSPSTCAGDPDRPAARDTVRDHPETDRRRYYASCSVARAAGAAPLRHDEPGYRPALDRDNDGVACE